MSRASHDEEFRGKRDDVLRVYDETPPGEHIICLIAGRRCRRAVAGVQARMSDEVVRQKLEAAHATGWR